MKKEIKREKAEAKGCGFGRPDELIRYIGEENLYDKAIRKKIELFLTAFNKECSDPSVDFEYFFEPTEIEEICILLNYPMEKLVKMVKPYFLNWYYFYDDGSDMVPTMEDFGSYYKFMTEQR